MNCSGNKCHLCYRGRCMEILYIFSTPSLTFIIYFYCPRQYPQIPDGLIQTLAPAEYDRQNLILSSARFYQSNLKRICVFDSKMIPRH